MNGLLTGKHERILALFRKLDHMTDRLGSPKPPSRIGRGTLSYRP